MYIHVFLKVKCLSSIIPADTIIASNENNIAARDRIDAEAASCEVALAIVKLAFEDPIVLKNFAAYLRCDPGSDGIVAPRTFDSKKRITYDSDPLQVAPIIQPAPRKGIPGATPVLPLFPLMKDIRALTQHRGARKRRQQRKR